MHSFRTWRRCVLLPFLLCAVLGLSMAVGTPVAFASPTLYASPGGTGATCSLSSPCDLPTAVKTAAAGSTISLLSGNYGDVSVKGGHATATSRITISPASGATVRFGRLGTYAPYVTWEAIVATVDMYIYPPATGTTTDRITLDGGGMFLRSSNVTVSNSEFFGGTSIDGIQLGRATNALIVGNDIHNFTDNGTTGYHADCIQMFDSSGITIRANNLRNCYNSAIIFSPGANTGVSNVLIESNFVQGCLVVSKDCDNGNALDLRYAKATQVVVRNNTFLNGSVRLESPGAVFDRNIVGYLSDCTAVMTNSIVEQWNTGLCPTPSAVGQKGNRQGNVPVVDAATGNLHLITASSAVITPYPGTSPAPTDYDGQKMAANLAGADTPNGYSATPPPPSDTTPPKVSVTSPVNNAVVRGAVVLQAVASDNVGVVSVGYYANGDYLGAATLASGNWNLLVNTSGIKAGSYQIVARASDAAGNFTNSTAVNVVIGSS